MDTDTLETIIDNAIERHGLRVVYNIFTSYDLIPCLVDAHGNYWTEPNLAGYVDGEPFETCLAYLAGDAKKEDLHDHMTHEIAIANLEGNTDKAKRLSERYLDQMEEMANNRG